MRVVVACDVRHIDEIRLEEVADSFRKRLASLKAFLVVLVQRVGVLSRQVSRRLSARSAGMTYQVASSDEAAWCARRRIRGVDAVTF